MFTVFLVAIAVAANRAEEDTSAREPAAVAAPELRHTAKLRGPVEARIDLIGEAPAAPGDVFTLRGEVTSQRSLDRIAYHWSLPGEVEVINGTLEGEIAHLDARQTQVLHLTLRAKTSTNQQVHLLASAKSRGARFADTAQFNTTAQAAFAASRARLSKSTAERAVVDRPRALRVMH